MGSMDRASPSLGNVTYDLFTCMPILRSAPARPARSTFVDLSHDNNSGQTYTINQVTGLSYSTSTYPDLERGGKARRGGGRALTIPCLLGVSVPHERSLALSNPEPLQPRHTRATGCAGERGASDGFVLSPDHPARSELARQGWPRDG